jgi:hypothetical protein
MIVDEIAMHIRRFRLPLLVAALVAGSTLAATPASAVPADCSVLDLTPKTIPVGISLKAPVVFTVATDCPADSVVNWYLAFNRDDATGPYTGPLLANFDIGHDPKPTPAPGGAYTWDVSQYGAGGYQVTISAFIGPSTDDVDLPRATLPVAVLHRTTFGSSFNASPEPRRVGQKIKITGQLTYANWKTATYDNLTGPVMLQFRPAGKTSYQDVKLVQDTGSGANTTVKAVKTGSWRYHFLGDPANDIAASYSKADTVVVKPAR